MLTPCQSPLWYPIQQYTIYVPFGLLKLCYYTCYSHSCDMLSLEMTIFLRQLLNLSSVICCSRRLFVPAANTWIDRLFFFSLLFYLFLFYFFMNHFSRSEDILYKYLQSSAMQYILLNLSFPSTHAKELTKRRHLSCHTAQARLVLTLSSPACLRASVVLSPRLQALLQNVAELVLNVCPSLPRCLTGIKDLSVSVMGRVCFNTL